DFANTPYQDQGHLFMAKLFMDSVDYENAILQLEFLIENSTEESLQHIARIRIARIKLQQNLYDEALQILQTESMGSFEAKYEEIKGDIFSKKREFSEAQAAYLKALDLLLPGEFDYEYIQMKFKDIQSEDLNEAEASKDGNA
ncbi:MAG: tetratricopeptide repeat protein, partial [Candidatus Poribacteria bacterium]|nr:tetratricopeptide repeat protein [Candidatus Poribacteria bacterium]